MTYLILILIFLVIIVVLYFTTKSLIKQSDKEWLILKELQDKANLLNDSSTKEELMDFFKDFYGKAKEIDNSRIVIILYEINGYVKALFKK